MKIPLHAVALALVPGLPRYTVLILHNINCVAVRGRETLVIQCLCAVNARRVLTLCKPRATLVWLMAPMSPYEFI